nr:MAG TPA: hypothetical protein [Caudoviricetes sp.]
MVKIPERPYAYLATNLPAAASPGAAARPRRLFRPAFRRSFR